MARRVEIPCTVFEGMFPGEVQVEIKPLDQAPIYVFASSSSTSTDVPVTRDGVSGVMSARMIGEAGNKVIVDLPGEARPIGPRVHLLKDFVKIIY